MTLFRATSDAIADRVGRSHANHRRIAKGAFLTALFVIAAKLFVAGKEIAIAWRYGVGATVDAYQLAFTISSWLPMMLSSIAISVLVPRLIGLEAEPDRRKSFIAELNSVALAVGLTVTALTFFVGPLLVHWMGGGMPARTEALTVYMLRTMAPLALLVVLASCCAIRLQARENYAYSFMEAVPAILTILFILLAPASMGPGPLIWGALIGTAVQFLITAVMVNRADGGVGTLAVRNRSHVWGTLYGAFAMMGLGQLVLGFAVPIDQAFAAQLGEGALSVLGYVNRLIGLLSGIGTIILARALLPVLSSVVATGDHDLGRKQVVQWAWLMLILGCLAAGLAWLLAPTGIAVLLQRGAFSSADSEAVTHVFRYGLIQLPFYFGGIVVVQWFAASRRYDMLLAVAVFAIIAKFALNYLLIDEMGLVGIVVATAAMYAVSFIIQITLVRIMRVKLS